MYLNRDHRTPRFMSPQDPYVITRFLSGSDQLQGSKPNHRMVNHSMTRGIKTRCRSSGARTTVLPVNLIHTYLEVVDKITCKTFSGNTHSTLKETKVRVPGRTTTQGEDSVSRNWVRSLGLLRCRVSRGYHRTNCQCKTFSFGEPN